MSKFGYDISPDVGRATQWKPGQSGNPKGKPKGTIHVKTIVRYMLEDKGYEQMLKDGRVLRGMPLDAIIKTAIAKAISGDYQSMSWLAKYGYGPPRAYYVDKTEPVLQLED